MCVLVEMFIIVGVILCSIGVSEGIGWLFIVGGSVVWLVNGSVFSVSMLYSLSVCVM